MKLVDSSLGTRGQTTTLTRIYKLDDGKRSELVRVRVERNFYTDQSFATAAVLRNDWVVIAEAPPNEWWRNTSETGTQISLAEKALAKRAEAILSA